MILEQNVTIRVETVVLIKGLGLKKMHSVIKCVPKNRCVEGSKDPSLSSLRTGPGNPRADLITAFLKNTISGISDPICIENYYTIALGRDRKFHECSNFR